MKNDSKHQTQANTTNTVSRRDALRLLGMGGLAVGGASLLSPVGFAQSVAAPTTAVAGHYRQKIGELEVFVLLDGTLNFPIQAYGITSSVGQIGLALNQNFLPVGATVTTNMNSLLIKSPQGIVLIDAGTGGRGGPSNGGQLLANLASIGIQPEDVNVVIMSHLHPDHIGGLFNGGAASVATGLVFKNAEHVITKREALSIQNPNPALQARPANVQAFFATVLKSYTATLEGKVKFVAPGDQVIPGVEILDAPGHTPGHIAVRISSGKDQMIHLVDTAAHHVLGFQPEFRLLFDEDPATAAATRAKLFDQIATDRTLVLGYHYPWPGLGHIRKTTTGYEWVHGVWDWAANS
jgi:glyoxylase-like metal-dependent hydrolase (beta-lactamase superfamily II)